MSQQTTRLTKPEEEELARKRIELSELESALADQELNLTALRSEISAFERTYLRIVGKRYAELDEIEAEIAEELARVRPTSESTQAVALQARDRATASHAVIAFKGRDF